MTVEQFDKWLSENFYPALAGLCAGLEGYKITGDVARRYSELCEGEVENRFDRMLREKVYPILAWVQTLLWTIHRAQERNRI